MRVGCGNVRGAFAGFHCVRFFFFFFFFLGGGGGGVMLAISLVDDFIVEDFIYIFF